MSPQHFAAQHMAAQGRGPDSQLVHMSPREVAGLQALAMASGGSLSINPNTGLPEAGFLDKMLPMILGIGATALTGGAAAPWMIGLGVGGIEAARTGDLGKGLMAGLGAYGGAGLAGGLMAAGAAGGAGAAGAGAANTAGTGTMAGVAGSGGAAGAAPTAFPFEMFSQGAAPPMPEFISQSPALDVGSHIEALGTPRMPFSTPVAPPTTPPPSTFSQNLSQMGRGLSALTEPAGREAFMGQAASQGVEATGVGGGTGLLKYGAAAGLPFLLDQGDGEPPPADSEQYKYEFDPGRVADPELGYTGAPTGQRTYFRPTYRRVYAEGGPVENMSAANVYDMQNARGGVSDMGIDVATGMQRMADGGISHLGDYSDGGRLLRGPGDGVSDSIPATIGDRRPARLADGEFVVPARIVSELGNGSTDAGARKLYAMMDRVQRARGKTVGKGKVAKNTRADKFLPA